MKNLVKVFLLGILIIKLVKSSLLASSQIEQCINDGNETMQCEEKLVVTLTLESGQDSTESLKTVIDTVQDGNETKRLQYPIQISFSKSESLTLYPVVYVRDILKPSEEIVYKGLITDQCKDGTSSDPTCGFVKENGNIVPYSQGYCCTCSLAQILHISDKATRAKLSCSLFGDGSSAHCLRFSWDLVYSIYSIGTPETLFNISLNITEYNTTTQKFSNQTLILSPENPDASTNDGDVVARLLGDFSLYKQAPDFSAKYLCVPRLPVDNPIVQGGWKNWMLIDKVHFDLSGDLCGKIGVSYEAFTNEANACQKTPGSCLTNQLDDFYQADEAKRQLGQTGDYFIENFGKFQSYYLDDEHNRYLLYDYTQMQSSVVTLTIPADKLQFIINRATGELTEVWIDNFEAGSKNGKMHVSVMNTGNVVADFTVTVTNCTQQIKPIQAQKVSLYPNVEVSLTLDVYAQNELDTSNQCTVSLYDSLATLLDQLIVYFNSTSTIHDYGPGQNDTGNSTVASDSGGCESCSGIFSVLCKISRGCFGGSFSLSDFLSLIVFAIFCYLFFRLILCSCRCCCRKRNANNSSRSSRKSTVKIPKIEFSQKSKNDQTLKKLKKKLKSKFKQLEKAPLRQSTKWSRDPVSETLHPSVSILDQNAFPNIQSTPCFFRVASSNPQICELFGPQFCVFGLISENENENENENLFDFHVPKNIRFRYIEYVSKVKKYRKLKHPRPLEPFLCFAENLSQSDLEESISVIQIFPCLNKRPIAK
ncbi:protein hapless 2 [Anaeramoeba ignava]|uniref:Protein hapless 2 n=1 Tax=Anaeramoeba ignava TaxID=1746090 RepID=A0A9Q0R3X7_ANAIG|nr:protein hapless 2 [Anaeramoeba ignava]